MALLVDRLRAAAAGQGGHVLVQGMAGAGKSRLLAEIATVARESGFAVVDTIPLLGREELADLLACPDRRFLLIDRLSAAVAERTREGPILVIVDDAHLSDPTALLVLRGLASPVTRARCLCVVAMRPAPVSAELARALAVLRANGAAELLLQPLPQAAAMLLTEEVVGAVADPAIHELAAGASGNPRYQVDLLDGLLEEGAIAVSDGAARLVRACLPGRLLSTVRNELLALSAEARELLDAASVFGTTFSVRDVASLLGCPGGRLLPAAHEALRAGILDDEPPRLAFRQALVSDAIHEDLGEARRRRLAREAVTVLGADLPPGKTALQFAARTRTRDPRAIALLDAVAGELAVRTPGAAAKILVQMMERLPPSDARRPTVAGRAGAMLVQAGRLVHAGKLWAATGDESLLVPWTQSLLLAGRYDEVIERATRALAGDGLPARLRAHLRAFEAAARAQVGGLPEAEAVVAAATYEGEATRQDAVVVIGLCAGAGVELRRGRLAQAHAAALAAVRRADGGSIDARRRHPRLDLALVLTAQDRLEDAEQALAAVRQEIAEYGSTWALPLMHVLRAELLAAAGRLDAAVQEASTALGGARDSGAAHVEARALLQLLHASIRMRSPDAAASAARDVRRLREAGAKSPHLARALALAQAHDDGGDDDAQAGVEAPPADILIADPGCAPLVVRATLRAGDAAMATVIAADLARLARLNRNVPSLVGCDRHTTGLVRQDVPSLSEAAESLRAGPRPLALAAALEDLGRGQSGRGEREAAISAFDESLGLWSASGATADAVRIRRELRALGARRRQTANEHDGAGWDGLTRTEHAVARLVAEGLSNRRVAERLFVSASTVDTHLEHIFGKLGINSRVQLARMVMVRASA
jgi:DNA-binding CsgD family transcriptional regulator